jgi:hypothetical protein
MYASATLFQILHVDVRPHIFSYCFVRKHLVFYVFLLKHTRNFFHLMHITFYCVGESLSQKVIKQAKPGEEAPKENDEACIEFYPSEHYITKGLDKKSVYANIYCELVEAEDHLATEALRYMEVSHKQVLQDFNYDKLQSVSVKKNCSQFNKRADQT